MSSVIHYRFLVGEFYPGKIVHHVVENYRHSIVEQTLTEDHIVEVAVHPNLGVE